MPEAWLCWWKWTIVKIIWLTALLTYYLILHSIALYVTTCVQYIKLYHPTFIFLLIVITVDALCRQPFTFDKSTTLISSHTVTAPSCQITMVPFF